jgi:ketosteroid isomerase-like protein
MSAEHVERVRNLYASWNAHDWDAVIAETEDDHEFHLTGLFPGLRPVYKGKDGVREFLESFVAVWKDFRVEVDRVEDVGDRVVGLVHLHGAGTGSGVPVAIEYAHVFTFDGDRAVRTDGHRTWKGALEAVGLDA